MTKQITITMGDHVYQSVFYGFEGNKSRRMEKLVLLGLDVEVSNPERNKALLAQIHNENLTLKDKLKKCQTKIGFYKQKEEERKNRRDPNVDEGWYDPNNDPYA